MKLDVKVKGDRRALRKPALNQLAARSFEQLEQWCEDNLAIDDPVTKATVTALVFFAWHEIRKQRGTRNG